MKMLGNKLADCRRFAILAKACADFSPRALGEVDHQGRIVAIARAGVSCERFLACWFLCHANYVS